MKKALLATAFVLFSAFAFATWPERPLPAGVRATRIVVTKHERTLALISNGRVVKTYRISLGPHPRGHKEREGDNRTPEGVYAIDRHKPDSSFHRALHVSYPNARDVAHAAALGVSPGGDIMIHGLPDALGWIGRLHRLHDWTAGCMAVTNQEIEEIYRAAPDGTPVEIRP